MSSPLEPLSAGSIIRLEFPTADYLYWLYYGSITSAILACIVAVGIIAWPASKYYFGGGFVFFMFIAMVLYIIYQIRMSMVNLIR